MSFQKHRKCSVFAKSFSLLFLVSIFAAFKAPEIPNDSRRIYRFDHVDETKTFQSTQAQGASPVRFSLIIGFKENNLTNPKRAHRKRAQELSQKIERKLNKLDLPDTEITVTRIYSATREIMLDVQVAKESDAEPVKERLLQLFRKASDVSFAGPPSTVRVE